MPTFRERDGRIQVQIRVRGAKAISATFPTLKQAQGWAVIEEAKLKSGDTEESLLLTERRASQIVFGDALEEYGRHSAPLSVHSRYALRYALREPVARMTITKLTKQDALLTKANYLKRFSPGTAAKYFHYLKRTMDYIIEDRKLVHLANIFDKILAARDKKRWTRFTPQEQSLFMSATHNTTLIDFVNFALETAMRRSEILGIRQHHIVDGEELPRLYIPNTKTDRPRTIPLTQKALAVLERRLRVNSIVFDISGAYISRLFKSVCDDAGLVDKHLHDLRHEALSRYSALGLNTPQLMQLSGHRDLASLAIYVNGTGTELAKSMKSLAVSGHRG